MGSGRVDCSGNTAESAGDIWEGALGGFLTLDDFSNTLQESRFDVGKVEGEI